ncbi:hypothetical protein U8V72_23340 [Priestia filamentosa]|uniref:hypothetical protein n=1 Tax=Priestia filamentosa TaxID=1402861 RepID=UPI0005896CEE
MIEKLINYFVQIYYAENVDCKKEDEGGFYFTVSRKEKPTSTSKVLKKINYEGEDEEGLYFMVLEEGKKEAEFRVLKRINLTNGNNVERREIGEKDWNLTGIFNLRKSGIFV